MNNQNATSAERTYFGFDAYTENSGKRAFISYRRDDKKRIYDVVYRLSTYAGESGNLWYDGGIGYGDKWEQVIHANVKMSSCIVAFISDRIFEGYMRKELEYAIKVGKPIIPVMVENYQPTMELLSAKDRRFWKKVVAIDYIPWNENTVENINRTIKKFMADDNRSIEAVCKRENFLLEHPLLIRRSITAAVIIVLLLSTYGLVDKYFPEVMENVLKEYISPSDIVTTTVPTSTTTITGQTPPVFTTFDASSSYNVDKYNRCTPKDAFDGNSKTEWQDGVDGYGVGEYLIAYSNNLQHVETVTIVNGYAGDVSLYNQNSRVASLLIEWEGGSRTVSLKDTTSKQKFDLGGIDTTWMRFTILDVYKGDKYKDTCIADIYFD